MSARLEVAFDELVAVLSELPPGMPRGVVPEVIATEFAERGWDAVRQRAEELATQDRGGAEWLALYWYLVAEFGGRPVVLGVPA